MKEQENPRRMVQWGLLSFPGCLLIDGIQNMLPHNMAPGHNECLKLKEHEKCHVQERLSDLPSNHIIKASCEKLGRKEHPYLQDEETLREA